MKKFDYFNKIIIPVDGSEASIKAAKKAFYISRKTGIDAIVLHIVHVPTIAIPATQTTYMEDIAVSLIKHGKLILDEIEKIGRDFGLKVKKVLLEGLPDDEIIKFANENDLIVMGSKGHNTFSRILIGSVSEKVLHHSNAAVMIVR
jgi:nucleotide-binding universal stress UspA family protein